MTERVRVVSSSIIYTGTATLVALHPDVRPTEFALTGDACLIGRASTCNIVVSRLSVSRLHAKIARQGMYFVLSDASSANGTFVNGKQIQDVYQLKDQDEIGLANGHPLLRFHDHDATILEPRQLYFERREQRFIYKGVPIDLSPNLMRLLTHLFMNFGEVCTRESCIQSIWGDIKPDPDRIPLLHKEISELREKFQAIDPMAEVIKTRRGIGYYLDIEH